MSRTVAAEKLGIAKSVLSKLLKSRYKIETSFISSEMLSRKRQRDGKDSEVEQALKMWFVSVREHNCRIDWPILKQKAEDFARKLGHTNFCTTDGWFGRWKKREYVVEQFEGRSWWSRCYSCYHLVRWSVAHHYWRELTKWHIQCWRVGALLSYMFKEKKGNLKSVKTCNACLRCIVPACRERKSSFGWLGRVKASVLFQGC